MGRACPEWDDCWVFCLGVRLKSEVDKELRSEVELRMRKELDRIVKNSEEVFASLAELVTAGMLDFSRAERGRHFFPVIGLYLYQLVSDFDDMPEENAEIFGHIALLLQNESSGY